MIAIPVADNVGPVAMIVGRTPQVRCNERGHGPPSIAIRAADDCDPLYVAPGIGVARQQHRRIGETERVDAAASWSRNSPSPRIARCTGRRRRSSATASISSGKFFSATSRPTPRMSGMPPSANHGCSKRRPRQFDHARRDHRIGDHLHVQFPVQAGDQVVGHPPGNRR